LVPAALLVGSLVVTWIGHAVSNAGARERELELRDAWLEEAREQNRKVRARVRESEAQSDRVVRKEREEWGRLREDLLGQIDRLRAQAGEGVDTCGCTLDSPLPEGWQ